MNAPRGVALLGATGSIGRSALSVFEALPERFRVVSMSAGSNLDALLPAIARFRPAVVSVKEREAADRVRREFPGLRVGWGEQGIVDVATHPEAEVVLGAVVGAAGLLPAWEAVRLGKTLALANKEVLVVAGEAVMAAAAASGAAILPVDSEHCALHQALRCGRPEEVDRVATLGPDPLSPEFTLPVLQSILAASGRSQIKGVLRNQSRIAGSPQHLGDLPGRAAAGLGEGLVEYAGPYAPHQIFAGGKEGAHYIAAGDRKLRLIQARKECCD